MLKWGPFVIAGGASFLAAWLVPLEMWGKLSNGLIAFLGLLAASIVQVIPVTANFLQSDRLTEVEATRLCAALKKQQQYWLGLLMATIIALVVVIAVSLAGEKTATNVIPWTAPYLPVKYSQLLSGFVGFVLCFVMVKVTGIATGVLSLQRLRESLVLAAAKRATAAEVERVQALQRQAMSTSPSLVPENYGEIVAPRH